MHAERPDHNTFHSSLQSARQIEATCLGSVVFPTRNMRRLFRPDVLRPRTQFRSISRNSIVGVASNSLFSSEKVLPLQSAYGKASHERFPAAARLDSKRFFAHYDKPKNIINHGDEDEVPMIREYIKFLTKRRIKES